MPVMVLYKEKSIAATVAADICQKLAAITKALLQAKIEVRVLEPVSAYNANEIHVEMRFRDVNDWTEDDLQHYHSEVMDGIKYVLKEHGTKCSYSFYIIPSLPPRSIWSQQKTTD